MEKSLFGKRAILLIVANIALLIFGYVLLGTGPVDGAISMVFAPVVLVAVYLVAIPISILSFKK